MSLTIGTRIGSYEVTALIGTGGMGEVYRARDMKLDRDVALKVLPDAFTHDADRLARFEREAKVLAALNHPHIAHIYGFEDRGAVKALVMELVEGPTLDDHLKAGALAVADALPIARQIAEALDVAHEAGIVHRDLKPANVKLKSDGTVKVVDFGLAKAIASSVENPQLFDATQSPTFISPLTTQSGVILGTAAYMSPEQARGKPVDKRADIWAFGCVLYEMLTGRRPFAGETVADVLAAVMGQDPDWSQLSAAVPPSVVDLIRRCLRKDVRHRLRDIGDAIDALQGTATTLSAADQRRPTRHSRLKTLVPWLAAAAAVVIFGIVMPSFRPPSHATSESRPLRLETRIGGDVSLVSDQGPAAVVSPDGSIVAFIARKIGLGRQLYVRRLDQLETTALAGTEDAFSPFFSPDGQWLAFFARGKLKKVPTSGGAVVVLCDAGSGRGGAWGDDGSIIFTRLSSSTPLYRVNANGGVPTPLTTLGEGEVAHRWPQLLPGGRGVLYSSTHNLSSYNDGDIVVKALPNGGAKTVLKGGHFGRYVQSGHLTYVHDGRLFAVPFDLARLEATGAPVPVLQRVSRLLNTGAAQFDVSRTGVAVYIAEDPGGAQPLEWLTRDGAIVPLGAPASDWSNVRISPDGQHVAMDRSDGQQTDIWLYDWMRNVMTQLTFDPNEDWMPTWTPDGRRIVFRSSRSSWAFNLHWQRSDGVGGADSLSVSRNPHSPGSWHPSGALYAYVENSPTTNYDIMLLPLSQKGGPPSGPPRPFLNTPAQEIDPAFSPDGRWMAYVSNESGKNAVYVRPFPGPGGQWLVASEGVDPTWSAARRELVYLDPDRRLMAAPYSVDGDTFRPEPARSWASARAAVRTRGMVGFDGRSFDLHPDGMRALGSWIPDTAPPPEQNTVIIAFNFFDELRRLAPTSR